MTHSNRDKQKLAETITRIGTVLEQANMDGLDQLIALNIATQMLHKQASRELIKIETEG